MVTETTRNKMRDAKKGIPRDEETKQKISEKNKIAVRGMKMVKGGHEKKVDYDEIFDYLSDGWFFKNDRIWMNNGERHVLKVASRFDYWLDQGWTWGTITELNNTNLSNK